MQRLLGISAGISVVAFVVAGICRHAKHGVGLYLGDVAWFTLLAGVAVTVVLAAVVVVRILRSRRSSLAVRS
jgi:hypothetical protein